MTESDVLFPYANWDGEKPKRSVVKNRVHSRAWHNKKALLQNTGRTTEAIKRMADISAKIAVVRWEKLFPP